MRRFFEALQVQRRRRAEVHIFMRLARVQEGYGEALSAQVAPMSSCKAGCSACCQQLVKTTLPNAVALLAQAQRNGILSEVMRAVEKQVQDFGTVPEDRLPEAWWNWDARCPLLTRGGRCGGYQVRPIPCMGYWVTSPPERCEKRYLGAQQVQYIDVYAWFEDLLSYLRALVNPRRLDLMNSYAPMPFALHFAHLWLTVHPRQWEKIEASELYQRHGFKPTRARQGGTHEEG